MKIILFVRDDSPVISSGLDKAISYSFSKEGQEKTKGVALNDLIRQLYIFFNPKGIKIELYDKNKTIIEDGDIPFLGNCSDADALLASQLFDNFYPYEAVYNLVQKHLLPSYLGQYGFNILPTKIVKSIDDIDIENFMLKHIIGAGAKDINFVADDLFYKKIRNKKELLDKNSIDDINAILAKGVVCQKYIDSYVDSPEKNVQVAILGFVNKHSEILFGRNTKIVFNKSSRTADTDLGTLPTREYNLYPDIQDKLIPLIREKNIKNAVFNLQLMGKENSTEWYPTDFNFRQAPYSIAFLLLNNKDEITRQWNHLFNMPNTLPDTYGTKEEYKNGIHWKHFMRYNHNDAVPTLLRKTISNV